MIQFSSFLVTDGCELRPDIINNNCTTAVISVCLKLVSNSFNLYIIISNLIENILHKINTIK